MGSHDSFDNYHVIAPITIERKLPVTTKDPSMLLVEDWIVTCVVVASIAAVPLPRHSSIHADSNLRHLDQRGCTYLDW